MENPTIQILKTRRSIRKYKNQQITYEELETVLQAGTFAPTSRGKQAPVIVAVQNKDIKQELINMNAEIIGTKTNPYYDAPTIILVFCPNEKIHPNAKYDGSLVLGNMMNAAHSIGLGTCWIHREREIFDSPEGKALLKKLNLSDTFIGIGALAIGYPDEKPTPIARKKDYYIIIK